MPPKPGEELDDLRHTMSGTGTNTAQATMYAPLEDFTGAPGQDAKRWWLKLGTNLRRAGITNPKEMLIEFNSHLGTDQESGADVATWADTDHRVKGILGNVWDDDHQISNEDVRTVRDAFIEHWYQEQEETQNTIPDIESLKQGEGESLRQYFNRASQLLRTAGGEDNSSPSTQAVRSLLVLTTTSYKRGLYDPELKKRMMRLAEPDGNNIRTLQGTHEKAESILRTIKEENKELEYERKAKELEVLKEYFKPGVHTPALLEQVKGIIGYTPTKAAPPAALQGATPTTALQPTAPPPAPSRTQSASDATRNVRFNPPRAASTQGAAQQGRTLRPEDVTDWTTVNPWQLAADKGRTSHANFEPTHSPNVYVSGHQPYRYDRENPLCAKCGTSGHIGRDCVESPLTQPEQEFLWDLMQFQRQKNIARGQARDANAQGTNVRTNLLSVEVGSLSLGTEEDEKGLAPEDKPKPTTKGKAKVTQERGEDGGVNVSVFETEEEQARKRIREDAELEELKYGCAEHQGQGNVNCDRGKCDHDCCKPPKRKIISTRARRVAKQKNPGPQIPALFDEPVLDIRKMIKETKIVLPLPHLAQLSPYYRNELKRLITPPRRQRQKKKATAETVLSIKANVRDVSTELMDNIQKWRNRDKTHRAFSLPAAIRRDAKSEPYTIPRNEVIADQGSDINLIYRPLVARLQLPIMSVKQFQIPAIRMTVADGTKCDLQHWTHFEVKIQGIERKVWAFVCPTESQGLSLLLGVPYLEEVDAQIKIKSNMIRIGDSKRGEEVVTVQAPDRKPIAAEVDVETTKARIEELVAEVESEDEDEDDDEGGDDDDEDLTNDEGSSSDDEGSDEGEHGDNDDDAYEDAVEDEDLMDFH